jgi:hypothetical protein
MIRDMVDVAIIPLEHAHPRRRYDGSTMRDDSLGDILASGEARRADVGIEQAL